MHRPVVFHLFIFYAQRTAQPSKKLWQQKFVVVYETSKIINIWPSKVLTPNFLHQKRVDLLTLIIVI
jgi:hypothetical protein